MAHGHSVCTGTAHGLLRHHATTRAGTHTRRHVLLAGLHTHHSWLTHVRSTRTRDTRHLHRLAHVLSIGRHSWMTVGHTWLHARRVRRERHALHHNGWRGASERVESDDDRDESWSSRRRAMRGVNWEERDRRCAQMHVWTREGSSILSLWMRRGGVGGCG